ncbi:hypothetical protein [Mycoplasma hafezii]|uniref:hypothetical protein n=1 Tax=Mycoplasma hafezii TaxID=525886 RepID=UPI003CE91DAF
MKKKSQLLLTLPLLGGLALSSSCAWQQTTQVNHSVNINASLYKVEIKDEKLNHIVQNILQGSQTLFTNLLNDFAIQGIFELFQSTNKVDIQMLDELEHKNPKVYYELQNYALQSTAGAQANEFIKANISTTLVKNQHDEFLLFQDTEKIIERVKKQVEMLLKYSRANEQQRTNSWNQFDAFKAILKTFKIQLLLNKQLLIFDQVHSSMQAGDQELIQQLKDEVIKQLKLVNNTLPNGFAYFKNLNTTFKLYGDLFSQYQKFDAKFNELVLTNYLQSNSSNKKSNELGISIFDFNQKTGFSTYNGLEVVPLFPNNDFFKQTTAKQLQTALTNSGYIEYQNQFINDLVPQQAIVVKTNLYGLPFILMTVYEKQNEQFKTIENSINSNSISKSPLAKQHDVLIKFSLISAQLKNTDAVLTKLQSIKNLPKPFVLASINPITLAKEPQFDSNFETMFLNLAYAYKDEFISPINNWDQYLVQNNYGKIAFDSSNQVLQTKVDLFIGLNKKQFNDFINSTKDTSDPSSHSAWNRIEKEKYQTILNQAEYLKNSFSDLKVKSLGITVKFS